MATDSIFRVAFWVLFAGVLVMRITFALRVRRAGERFMPDQEAVEREGRVMFASRAGAATATTLPRAFFHTRSLRHAFLHF